MRIAIALMGSRGDVQPGIALALRLRERGHDVVLSVPQDFENLVRKLGLRAVLLAPDYAKDPESAKVWKSVNSKKAFGRTGLSPAVWNFLLLIRRRTDATVASLVELCAGADVVVAGQTTEEMCPLIAQASGIPVIGLHYFPQRKNSFFPPAILAPRKAMPRRMIRAFWDLYSVVAMGLRAALIAKALRESLGLSRFAPIPAPSRLFERHGLLEVQSYYGELLPGLAEEWDERRPFIGHLRLPAAAREALGESVGLQGDLLEWIESGPAPIFFGFGSTPSGRTDQEILSMVEAVCGRLGQRAVVNFGSSRELPAVSEGAARTVRVVGAVAHDALFPLCRAAMVHGGIGTLSEALRAGIPVVVCWVAFDQPYWGMAVQRAGVGDHTSLAQLDVAILQEKTALLLEDRIVQNAKDLGALLRSKQDAAAVFCELIEAKHAALGGAKP